MGLAFGASTNTRKTLVGNGFVRRHTNRKEG